ncbi:MAG: FAD-binding oxidoreductase [Acidimicrobiia bacterium]|nr:FAD-binding oxidoreductase [Acidimicrobiia bacterium]
MQVRVTTADAVKSIPEDVTRRLEETVGPTHVTTADTDLREAGADWWPLGIVWQTDGDQPSLPAVVVRPGSADEVASVLAVANASLIPVTPFAGRSGVCGGSLPVRGGISLDLRRLDRIIEVDSTDLMVHVEAGVFGPPLEDTLRAEGVTVGHYPQSFDLATVGGWIACRGAGQLSNRYGKIEDMLLGLEVALANGSIMRTNPQPRAATGPDLMRLFVGAEGTLGVITSAWLKLWPAPAADARRAWSFDTFADGLEAMRRIMRTGTRPACVRLYDGPESARHFGTGDTRNAMIVLSEGDAAQVELEIAAVEEVVAGFGAAVSPEDSGLVDVWLEHRNDVSALHEVVERGIVVDTIEIAAPWSKLAAIYEETQAAVLGVDATLICTAHASHAYKSGGCVYFTFAGVPGDDRAAKDAYYRSVWDTAMSRVRAGGGTISHHHGIGLVRARFLREELGAGFDVLTAVKHALDPNGILNPGKLGLDGPVWPA